MGQGRLLPTSKSCGADNWCFISEWLDHFDISRTEKGRETRLAYRYDRWKRPDIHVTKKNWNRHFKENFLEALIIYPIVTFTDALLFHVQTWDELASTIFTEYDFEEFIDVFFFLLWCAECLSKWGLADEWDTSTLKCFPKIIWVSSFDLGCQHHRDIQE